jgi:hypothetical protein
VASSTTNEWGLFEMMKRTTLGLLTLAAMLCSTVSLAQLKHLNHGAAAIERHDLMGKARCDSDDSSEREGHVSRHGVVRRGDALPVQHVTTVAAPELDPTFATSALGLLSGCMAILRARRRTPKVPCQ